MYELNCYTIKHLFNSQKDFHLSVKIFLLLIIQSLPLDGLQGHSCPTLCHRLLCSCTLSISPSVSAGMFLSGFFAPSAAVVDYSPPPYPYPTGATTVSGGCSLGHGRSSLRHGGISWQLVTESSPCKPNTLISDKFNIKVFSIWWLKKKKVTALNFIIYLNRSCKNLPLFTFLPLPNTNSTAPYNFWMFSLFVWGLKLIFKILDKPADLWLNKQLFNESRKNRTASDQWITATENTSKLYGLISGIC